jgi:hypothetical protein
MQIGIKTMPLVARFPRTVFYSTWILPAIFAIGAVIFVNVTAREAAILFIWLIGVGIVNAFVLSAARVSRIKWVAVAAIFFVTMSVLIGAGLEYFLGNDREGVYFLLCTLFFLATFQTILLGRSGVSAMLSR